MIEMPEAFTIANQMDKTLVGKAISRFARGNLTHKFLWLNRSDDEYQTIFPGKVISGAHSYGRSIYLCLNGFILWWSDIGGKILYHAAGEKLPEKFHLVWKFSDGSALTFSMRMWGSLKLIEAVDSGEIPPEETGIPPLHPEFTIDNFNKMLDEYPAKKSKGVKGFLVATGYQIPNHINGLGNSIVQDILFRAKLSPKRKIVNLCDVERKNLFDAIQDTVHNAIQLGGRYDEVDLYGNNGGYIRLMDRKTLGNPCINCGKKIQKFSYLGGACYICPNCQT